MSQIPMTGLAFGESPRWHEDRLWLSNWGTHEILAVDLDGRTELMVKVPTTLQFSIDWLPDRRLVVVLGPEAKVLRQEPDGSLVTHADLSGIASGFNEIVVDGRGNTYVNGGGFDLMAGEEFRPGIVALVMPDGSARQVADGIAFGNGMAVTPDNSTLIVAESYGICLDEEGAVWYADVPDKCCVRVREGGEVLQKIDLDRGAFACMLGGPDGKTLFMVTGEWHGIEHMAVTASTGRLLTAPAPSPHAGRP